MSKTREAGSVTTRSRVSGPPTAGKRSSEPGDRALIAYCTVFLALLCWFLLFFFPGGMSWDSMRQLQEARSGVFSDAHPPVMALLWRYVDMLTAGPFGMLLLQCLFFLGGLTAIFYLTRTRGLGRNLVLLVAVALWPASFFTVGVIWKDVAMAAGYLASIALFFRYERSEGRGLRAVLGGSSLVMLLYGMSTRHNAAAAALPMLAFYGYRLLQKTAPRRRTVLAIAFGTVGCLLLFGLGQFMNGRIASVNNHFWQVSAVFDIGGMSSQERTNLFPADLYPRADLAMVDQYYKPWGVSPLWRFAKPIHPLTSDRELKELKTAWVRLILGHPRAFLKHRWAVFAELIGATMRAPSAAVPYGQLVSYRLELKYTPSQLNQRVAGACDEFAKRSLVFRPCAYMLVSALLLVALIWIPTANRALVVMLLSSGLLHMVGLFFVTGSPDFRYSHWMILCTVLGIAIMVRDGAGSADFPKLRRVASRWRKRRARQ